MLEPKEKYDLYIAVDCGELARTGENFVYFNNKNNTINIDHHGTNDMFAGLNPSVLCGFASSQGIQCL